MRIKSLLCSAAILGLLGTSYGVATQAHAETRMMYNPATQWSVSRIADKSQQGNDYCAAAQRFSKDAILTFARNLSSESSLALDFQKPKLNQGRVVSVTLDPGAGVQRFYEVMPASSKAFVVRMGQDDEFFTALEKTGFLRVGIEGNSYNFNLADINEGSFKLNSCVATMVMPAAGDEMDDGQPLEVAQENSGGGNYRYEINMLRKQMGEMKSENARLADLIEGGAHVGVPVVDVEAQVPVIDDIMPQEVAATDLQSQEIEELSTQIQALKNENVTLQKQMELATKDDSALQEELQKLLTNNTRMSARLEALQSNKLTTIRPEGRPDGFAVLKAENASLKKQLTMAQAEILSAPPPSQQVVALQQRITQLEGERAQLIAQNKQLNTELASVYAQTNTDVAQARQVSEYTTKLEAENERLDTALNEAPVQVVEPVAAQVAQDEATDLAEIEAQALKRAQKLEAMVPEAGDESVDVALTPEPGYSRRFDQFTPPIALSQAQRYEQALARDLRHPRRTPAVERHALPEMPIVAHASENPFEDILEAHVSNDIVPVAVVVLKSPAVEPLIETRVIEPVSVKSVQSTAFMTATSGAVIEGLLEGAAVVASAQDIEYVSKASNAMRSVYQWRSDQVYGSAEVKSLVSQGQFDQQVQAYLEQTQNRCEGDFAIVPDSTTQQGDTRIDTYEVACVGASVNSAVSLLFFNQGNMFTAVAHEAPAQDMESAMDIRDRVARSIRDSYNI